MVLGTPQNTGKFVDTNQTIDSLNYVKKIKLDIKLDGVSLNRVSSTKFLDVLINENLTWKNHIDVILKSNF